MSASGSEAPSRKENADAAWSSIYTGHYSALSVEHAVEKPSVEQTVEKQPAQRAVAERHIPFVMIPGAGIGAPPRARGAPRARLLLDVPAGHAVTIDRDTCRPPALDRDTHGNW